MDWFELVAAPALVGLGGLGVWYVQSRVEQIRTLERSLHEDRRTVYAAILEPYIRLFANLGDGEAEVTKVMLSYEYKKTAFELNLFGADNVVKAYNRMMQHAYLAETSGQDSKEMMRLWGGLLLEIRKSLGNPSKELDEWDMLRGMVKDLDSFI